MARNMITIDGTMGEGGGQVVRTSLALSAITGIAVEVDGVRGGRKKPGLMRQHLTGVRAAAEICGARVDGAEQEVPGGEEGQVREVCQGEGGGKEEVKGARVQDGGTQGGSKVGYY